MANSKDNISKYATSYIGFDEVSGNVYDSIGGYVGTIYNTPTRVTGWNGEGKAMSFNGTNQYVQFNNKMIKENGSFSIRLKFFKSGLPTIWGNILATTSFASGSNGWHLGVNVSGNLNFASKSNNENTNNLFTGFNVCDGKWHDIVLIFDKENMVMKAVIDEKNVFTTAITHPNITSTNNLILARSYGSDYLACSIDHLEIYDRVISPIPDKHLVLHNGQYKYHNGTSWLTTTGTEANFIQYGMNNLSHITEAQWGELTGEKSIAVWSDFEDKQYVSAVLEKAPFTVKELLGDAPELVYYTNSDKEQAVIKTETDSYSVYDYIGETPQVIAYTESTEDIIVSTTTEPFDLYDEFGDEVEVLFYTDDISTTESNLILEANWSPVDELEGNFEVITWTDEAPETAQRTLEATAIPKPQFVKILNPYDIYGFLEDLTSIEEWQTYKFRNPVRYLLTNLDTNKLFRWDFDSKQFVEVTSLINNNNDVKDIGMSVDELELLIYDDWKTWSYDKIGIAIYLEDNPRDTIISNIDKLSFNTYNPRQTPEISNAKFYILNTTAKIDLELVGSNIIGILDDEDLTRVQYRVILNNQNYYPVDGSFTNLSAPPQNINLSFNSNDIKIDDLNTVKVEFKDAYGTVDFWQADFIGTYNGILFKDVYGDYYSNEIGEVLKYLDFGIIIAGQTTVEHEIFLKNQYGYNLKNIQLYANTSEFPQGMKFEFSDSLSPFNPSDILGLGRLGVNEEKSFYVRIATEFGAVPNNTSIFDIIVRADKDE